MRYLMILALLSILLCSSSAFCQMNSTSSEELNASALRSLVADASSQSQLYRFLMEMEQNTDLVNLTTGEVQALYTRTISAGSINMSARSLKIVMASLTVPKGDEVNATAFGLDEYLINDSLYLKMDGSWTYMKLPEVAEAWSQQNTMKQQIDMLNQSNLTMLGSEVVGDDDCYILFAKVNSSAIAEQISKQTGPSLPVQFMNLSELLRNTTMNAYYWIAKDAHQLKKAKVTESFTFNPAYLGLPTNETENIEMRVNTTISMLFEDINESVNIILPEEAGTAKLFSQDLIATNVTQAATKA
ncbi:MAG: hypothetical protein GYA39_08170 [Methanothrix sp.]|nr:hypothetical protein [Methanothrix sp.]